MYVRALQANPRDPHAFHFLGVLMHQTGKSDDALLLLKQATEIEQGLTDAWCNLGNVQRDLEHFEEARKSYEQALSLEPALAEAWIGLGNLHQQTGAMAEAETAYRKALKLQPGSAEAFVNGQVDSHRFLGIAGNCPTLSRRFGDEDVFRANLNCAAINGQCGRVCRAQLVCQGEPMTAMPSTGLGGRTIVLHGRRTRKLPTAAKFP